MLGLTSLTSNSIRSTLPRTVEFPLPVSLLVMWSALQNQSIKSRLKVDLFSFLLDRSQHFEWPLSLLVTGIGPSLDCNIIIDQMENVETSFWALVSANHGPRHVVFRVCSCIGLLFSNAHTQAWPVWDSVHVDAGGEECRFDWLTALYLWIESKGLFFRSPFSLNSLFDLHHTTLYSPL